MTKDRKSERAAGVGGDGDALYSATRPVGDRIRAEKVRAARRGSGGRGCERPAIHRYSCCLDLSNPMDD